MPAPDTLQPRSHEIFTVFEIVNDDAQLIASLTRHHITLEHFVHAQYLLLRVRNDYFTVSLQTNIHEGRNRKTIGFRIDLYTADPDDAGFLKVVDPAKTG